MVDSAALAEITESITGTDGVLDSTARHLLGKLGLADAGVMQRAAHRLLLQDGLHHVARPAAHLLVDAADIFADQADAEQDHAEQEEVDGKQRKQALDLGAEQDAPQQQQHEQQG